MENTAKPTTSDTSKTIVCFDLETTGFDRQKDRITQIGAVRLEYIPEEKRWSITDRFNTYVNPGSDARWTDSAMKKTGITPEMVKDAPLTRDALTDFIGFLGDSDVLTYNGTTFDIPILKAECRRCGIDSPEFHNRQCYDSFVIETKLDPHDLGSVYKKYVGNTMDEQFLKAHNALSDVIATVSVFNSQMPLVEQGGMDIEFSGATGGMIGTNDEGERVFLYGKHRGDAVQKVILEDPGYVTWFIKDTGDKDIYHVIKEEYQKVHRKPENN